MSILTLHYFKLIIANIINPRNWHLLKTIPRPICGRNVPSITWKFVAKNINLSKPSYNHSLEATKAERVRAIVVGSDQVWRPMFNLNGELESMFLSHLLDYKIKKVAYAASFGTNEWEFNRSQQDTCAKAIQLFDAVSVREKSGIDLCRDYLNRNDALKVLDPTLLLTASDYLALIPTFLKKQKTDKTLCSYFLDSTTAIEQRISELSKSSNLKLVNFRQGDILVEEWLSHFSQADNIVTDSFHGTVFAIIFHKDFYTIKNDYRGNERLESLLSELDILDRFKSDVNQLPEHFEPIDWKRIDAILDQMRQKSMEFLSKNL